MQEQIKTELLRTILPDIDSQVKRSTSKVERDLETLSTTLRRQAAETRDWQDQQDQRMNEGMKNIQHRIDRIVDMIKVQQEASNTYKRPGVTEEQRDQVKSQISELREVAAIFQTELAKVQGSVNSMK
jgi:hypothetical protein